MRTATELRPLYLAERLAKVRNRMRVATLTKVPPSNKELFVAICRIYEQLNGTESPFSSELSAGSPLSLQELFFPHEIQEHTRQERPYDEGEDDSFCDWDKVW